MEAGGAPTPSPATPQPSPPVAGPAPAEPTPATRALSPRGPPRAGFGDHHQPRGAERDGRVAGTADAAAEARTPLSPLRQPAANSPFAAAAGHHDPRRATNHAMHDGDGGGAGGPGGGARTARPAEGRGLPRPTGHRPAKRTLHTQATGGSSGSGGSGGLAGGGSGGGGRGGGRGGGDGGAVHGQEEGAKKAKKPRRGSQDEAELVVSFFKSFIVVGGSDEPHDYHFVRGPSPVERRATAVVEPAVERRHAGPCAQLCTRQGSCPPRPSIQIGSRDRSASETTTTGSHSLLDSLECRVLIGAVCVSSHASRGCRVICFDHCCLEVCRLSKFSFFDRYLLSAFNLPGRVLVVGVAVFRLSRSRLSFSAFRCFPFRFLSRPCSRLRSSTRRHMWAPAFSFTAQVLRSTLSMAGVAQPY